MYGLYRLNWRRTIILPSGETRFWVKNDTYRWRQPHFQQTRSASFGKEPCGESDL